MSYGEFDEDYPKEAMRAFIVNYDWDDEDNGKIALPHSCDSWIIGGKKEAKKLIEDLNILIEKL